MPTYYINAEGNATAPYDTPERGHTSMGGLLNSIAQRDGDVIEIVNNGPIVEHNRVEVNADDLVIRAHDGSGISIISPSDNQGTIRFGDSISYETKPDKIKIKKKKLKGKRITRMQWITDK